MEWEVKKDEALFQRVLKMVMVMYEFLRDLVLEMRIFIQSENLGEDRYLLKSSSSRFSMNN